VRLALEESRAAYNTLENRQQHSVNATPGASGSGPARALAGASAGPSHSRAAPPPANSPPPAANAGQAPAHGGHSGPIVGVGAGMGSPEFTEFPKLKVQQTVRRMRAGLGAKKRSIWLEMQDAIRQAMNRTRLNYERPWTRQDATSLALLYPIVCSCAMLAYLLTYTRRSRNGYPA
jgi:hypothetical protein